MVSVGKSGRERGASGGHFVGMNWITGLVNVHDNTLSSGGNRST